MYECMCVKIWTGSSCLPRRASEQLLSLYHRSRLATWFKLMRCQVRHSCELVSFCIRNEKTRIDVLVVVAEKHTWLCKLSVWTCHKLFCFSYRELINKIANTHSWQSFKHVGFFLSCSNFRAKFSDLPIRMSSVQHFDSLSGLWYENVVKNAVDVANSCPDRFVLTSIDCDFFSCSECKK